MKHESFAENRQELVSLCSTVRELATKGERLQCEHLIFDAMRQYPHAPEPHNLIGVLLENDGDHTAAMKHFRAAWALDPTYVPARYNMERYGTLSSQRNVAFDEADCPEELKRDLYKVEYDAHGVGRIVRRNGK